MARVRALGQICIKQTFRNPLDIPLHNPFAHLRQTMQKMHNLRTKGLPYQGLPQELDGHTVLDRHTVGFTLTRVSTQGFTLKGQYVRVWFTSKGLPPPIDKPRGAVTGDINTNRHSIKKIDPHPPPIRTKITLQKNFLQFRICIH